MLKVRSLVRALIVCLLGVSQVGAQDPTGTVAGRIVDRSTGEPIAGVAVAVTDRGTLSDMDGRYTIDNVPTGLQTVRATAPGYAQATSPVTVVAGQTVTVDFSLTPQAFALREIVVIGYGEQQRRDVTGAVSSVSEEEFNTGRIVSPDQLIQAKVAGVQVVNTGEPGGSSSIRIRGGTSVNASNEPLVVVDGVPLAPGGGLSAGRNPLNFINPDDIENITVLKDASSTAIYGSRGANGVILVETKSGAGSATQFTYGTSMSTSQVVGGPDLLSAAELRTAVAAHAPGQVAQLGSEDTNWRDAVMRDAAGQEHMFAVTGAGPAMNYRLSVNYLEQEGVLQNTQTERVSAALSYDHRLLEDRLSISANVRGARTDDEFAPGGVLDNATIFDPTQPILVDGAYWEHPEYSLAPNNPLAELMLTDESGTTYRSIGNIEARYRMPFLERLEGTVRLGYDVAKSERRGFWPSALQWQKESPVSCSESPCPTGTVDRSNPTEVTGVLDAFLNYGMDLSRFDSDLDATVGYSYEQSNGDYPYFRARGLSTDLLGPNGVPAAAENSSTLFVRESRLASFFGRVNYAMLDRYLLTLSVRRDGSSRFAPGNQWGTFPAVAVGWRISEEGFMQGNDFLSDLKLRASWGVNGNQAIGDYLWVPNYRYSDPHARPQFGDEFVTTIRPTAVDPEITWEETTSTNIGADFGIMDNRFTGAIEYYRKNTEDLIFSVPVAAGAFVSNFVTTNVGAVRNQGIELSLNTRLLGMREESRGLTWDASFNIARNNNELTRVNPYGGGGERILTGGIAGAVGNNIQVLQPGSPVNAFYVLRHKRDSNGKPIYSDNLLEMYEDLSGDTLKIINEQDRVAMESPAPKWIIGHTSHLGFRAFDMSFTVRAHRGNHVYNNLASRQGFYNALTGAAGIVNLHSSVLENNFVEPQFFSDIYIEDASFIRMDNLTLGYSLPRFRGTENLRLFGTVQNVFTITDYSGVDPEAGLNGIDNTIYPRSRTYTLGVNVGF